MRRRARTPVRAAEPQWHIGLMGNADQPRDLAPVLPPCQLAPGRTLRDAAAVVFRRRRILGLLFLSIFGGTVAGTVWLRPRWDPPLWTAGLKFLIRRDRMDAVVTPAERSVPGVPPSVSLQEVLAEIELLKSTDVVERLARQAGVAVGELQRRLVAEPVTSGKNATNLIAVRYTGPDRDEVNRVLERLPEVYLEKYLNVNRRPGVVEYFRSQAEIHERELRQAEEALAEFEKAGSSGEGDARQRLADLERQSSEAEAALREAESRGKELERQLHSLPATVVQTRETEAPPDVVKLREELVELEKARAQATRYREIGRLEARIEQVRQAMEAALAEKGGEERVNPARAAVEEALRRNQVELAGLRARRAALTEGLKRARSRVTAEQRRSAGRLVGAAELTRKVKAAEETFLLYRKKHAEAREAELLDRSRVVNVSLAERPGAPVRIERRSWRFYLGFGLLLALAAAAAGGFAAEMLDHSVHTPRDLEACASVVVLASIPETRGG